MDRPGRSGLVGRAFWALSPFAPEAPFRLYAGETTAPIQVNGPAVLRNAARHGGDAEVTVLTPAKIRPILIVAESTDHFDGPSLLALRLQRFSKLSADKQKAVRSGDAPRFFHLRPDRFPGLPEENAAALSTLIRVSKSAVDTTESLGGLDVNELRVVHERIARHFSFDLTELVRELLSERIRDLRNG